MTDDNIRIERHELFDRAVDEALAKDRAGRERVVGTIAPPVSPLRRLLLNPLVYLPTAAAIGAFVAWLVLEPKIVDMPSVRGEVVLVNAEPFETDRGVISLTVGSRAVHVNPGLVATEPGSSGQPAFASIDEITVGTHIEAIGLDDGTSLVPLSIRPTDEPAGSSAQRMWPLFLLFPLTAALIVFGLLLSEGITTRNWVRMLERSLLGTLLAAVFATLAFIPAGLCFMVSMKAIESAAERSAFGVVTIKDVSAGTFLICAASRAAAWACLGAAIGVGMNLVRSTRMQLRNSVVGGALGGAFGGLFFDPVDRFVTSSIFAGSGTSRLVGLLAVAISVGVFVALAERLGRDGWLRVRTGPLAGKSFVLYKTPTLLGSAPQADIYLYKDAEIDASHAAIHRVGATYEIEDMGSRMGTTVGGNAVRRRRLASGDQIVVGGTVLDFEERQKRTPSA